MHLHDRHGARAGSRGGLRVGEPSLLLSGGVKEVKGEPTELE